MSFGNPADIQPKRCRCCGAVGEFPGFCRPCPACDPQPTSQEA